MTIPTPTPTPEQIAETIKHLRYIGSFTRDSAYSICNEAATLIEALAAQLAELDKENDKLADAANADARLAQIAGKRQQQAEAAVASARETALEEINNLKAALREMMSAYERRVRTYCKPDDLTKEPWRCAEYIEAERLLKKTFKLLFDNEWVKRKIATDPDVEPEAGNLHLDAPVTLSTESEVMPDTSGPRSNSGDTATPQASMLAPGADALIDRNALIDLLAKIEDGPYLGAEGVADAVIELLLPNLIRAHGGKP